MFKKLQARKDLNLLVEEKLYEHVANEMEAGDIRQGLWAKASVQSSSAHEADIRRKYIELRVEYLQAEGRLTKQFLEELKAAAVDEVVPESERTETQNASEDEVDETGLSFIVGAVIMFLIVIFILMSLTEMTGLS
jgi:hypothetical protein